MKNDFQYEDVRGVAELSDLSLVAALQCQGFTVESINRDPKEYPKVGFIFIKTQDLTDAVRAYWDGTLLVEPKVYSNAVRELKNRIKTK